MKNNELLVLVYIPESTVSVKELSANLNTALAASSGTTMVWEMSLGELLESLGAMEVAGTKWKNHKT